MFRGVITRCRLTPTLVAGAVLLVLLFVPPWLRPSVATEPLPAPVTVTPPLPSPAAQRAHLARHPKLLAAATVLAPFDQGLATSTVIVNLTPPAAAEALASQSRLSPRLPVEPEPGADIRYYDLLDEHIRGSLRDSVGDTLDQVLPSLDQPGLTLIQSFAYQYGFAAQVTPAALASLLDHPLVGTVEPDRPLSTAELLPTHPEDPAQSASGALSAETSLAPSSASLTGEASSPTMVSLITQWEAMIDRLDQERVSPPPVLATGQGGPVGEGAGPCDRHLPALAQAATNALAAGISLFAPAGDDGDCTALPWPACLSTVNAVGAVYAADQGLVGWCVTAASCAAKTADDTCASGYLALEQARTDQVPAYSNSTDDLSLLAPAAFDPSGTEGTQAATAATLAAASAMQHAAMSSNGTWLTPAEVQRILAENGTPITDIKSGITTPRVDLPRALESIPGVALDAVDRAQVNHALSLTIDEARQASAANKGAAATPIVANVDPTLADAGTPMTCPPDRDADLVDQNVTDTRIYQTCETLAAGPFTIAGTGSVTFEVGQSIRLRPGFKVASGGRLMARVSSDLAESPGALQVTLYPTEAVTAGAQWRRVGSVTWRDSGFLEDGLAVGDYQVEFKSLSAWVSPPTTTLRVSPATTTAISPLYSPVPVTESITVALPPSQTQGLELSSLSEEGIEVTAQQIAVPSHTPNLVFLTDAEDNLAGIGISTGDGSARTIDATSTAIGLVIMANPGWSSLSLTMAELEARIRAATGFQNLVNLIAARQQSDAIGLLDDVDILTSVTDVVLEVLQTIAMESSQAQAAVPSLPDSPWVENGQTIRNPRYIPYGLSARNIYGFFERPFILDEREFSWEFDWMPIQPIDPTQETFDDLTQGKLCAVRFDPLENYFAPLMISPGFTGALLVSKFSSLSANLYALPADQYLYRRAELNGMIAWNVSILINVAKSVPGGIGIGGSAAKLLWNQIKEGADIVAFTKDAASEGVEVLIPLLLKYAYETRTKADSLLRKTATAVFNDGRKIRNLGITAKYLAKIFEIPQYLTDVWFVKDTLLAPVSACYAIDGGSAVSFDPWSSSAFVPPLNDTGLDWCMNYSQDNLACPVSGFPGQDAEHGRDVTHNDDSDGQAGFSFTKISNSGNPLPASATLGSGANDWGCTRDNVTGLTWEVKTDDGGLRDKDWTYSWYNPDAATNGGSAGYADYGNNCFNTARCDIDKFVADVKAQGLCGASDWRLPNLFELESITSQHRFEPAIDTGFFPNTTSSFYWSSSPCAQLYEDTEQAWAVTFGYADVACGYKAEVASVRFVRGGQ